MGLPNVQNQKAHAVSSKSGVELDGVPWDCKSTDGYMCSCKLTRTSRGLRTVRTGHAYRPPPACCTYRRLGAAWHYCTYTVRVPAPGVPYVPRTVWCTTGARASRVRRPSYSSWDAASAADAVDAAAAGAGVARGADAARTGRTRKQAGDPRGPRAVLRRCGVTDHGPRAAVKAARPRAVLSCVDVPFLITVSFSTSSQVHFVSDPCQGSSALVPFLFLPRGPGSPSARAT